MSLEIPVEAPDAPGVGYRILDINYSEGRGAEKFQFDVQRRGPIPGFAIPIQGSERHGEAGG